ncbi:VOC family protein [Nemorincola caseinilytica]|uniref:VOC family protein n=1 Tax=Nemorincola caseinilytica TaxID=2054315 RepID=A0ABP8NB84_9BACT
MNKLFSYTAIPCEDFERAFAFYNHITNGMLARNPHVPFPMAYFTDKDGNNVGHLFQLPPFRPAGDGAVVYMEPADIDTMLAQIEKAGGKTIMPKTPLGPGKGHWAVFLDSEGNKLALHTK